LSYSTVDALPGADNKGLLSSRDCLLSPCGPAHSDPGNDKQQVPETSFYGNKKTDIVTLAATNSRQKSCPTVPQETPSLNSVAA
jgi:hypothetical protein